MLEDFGLELGLALEPLESVTWPMRNGLLVGTDGRTGGKSRRRVGGRGGSGEGRGGIGEVYRLRWGHSKVGTCGAALGMVVRHCVPVRSELRGSVAVGWGGVGVGGESEQRWCLFPWLGKRLGVE